MPTKLQQFPSEFSDLPEGVFHISELLPQILFGCERMCLLLINGIGDEVRREALGVLRTFHGLSDSDITTLLESHGSEAVKAGNLESAKDLMKETRQPRQMHLWDEWK